MPLRGSAFKGFPFDSEGAEDEGWGELSARHPDLAARLRRPAPAAAWARKRRSPRPHQADAADDDEDFVSGLGEHFNRFPFNDIPPEFREHLPSRWGHRYAPHEHNVPDQNPHRQQNQSQTTQTKPSQSTIATQTDEDIITEPPPPAAQQNLQAVDPEQLPQYGLRNTVDLGQKSPADPSLLDAEERNLRSMSAPPDNRVPHPNQGMGGVIGGNQAPPPQNNHQDSHSTVRHIPIFVEGRDEPVINKAHADPPVSSGDPHPQYASSPPQHAPQHDREFFDRPDSGMGFHHGPNYSRTFGTPFAKGFRQGHQPFGPQAPQGRAQSPKPQPQPQSHYTQIPVHHEPSKQHQHPQQHQHFQQQQQPHPHPQQQHPHPQQQQHPHAPQQQQREQTPPPQQQQPPPPPCNDPIAKIVNIQKEVLELMNQVENFAGKKTDKQYIYLDEMLTRNLIKLDDIETEGKENIRQARKEAIKCIQKCIAVLEAKAEGKIPTTPQPNSEVQPDFDAETEAQGELEQIPTAEVTKEENQQVETEPSNKINPEATDNANSAPEEIKPPEDAKTTPKKTKKVVKKRDKSKDKKEENAKPADVEMKESAESVQPMETDMAVSSQ